MKGKLVWIIVSFASIWLSVLFVSIFAPDLVTGSQQEHFPIAPIVTWISGAAATRSVLRALGYRRGSQLEDFRAAMVISIGAAILWAAVALVGIFVPELRVGTDPTRIPLAAILAPIGGAIVTGTLGQLPEYQATPQVEAGRVLCPACGKENPRGKVLHGVRSPAAEGRHALVRVRAGWASRRAAVWGRPARAG